MNDEDIEILSKMGFLSEDDIVFEKGLELSTSGKLEEALPYFRKAVELEGKSNVLYLQILGQNLTRTGRYEEALPFLEKAVEMGNHPWGDHYLGIANFHMSRYQNALACFEKAAEFAHRKRAFKSGLRKDDFERENAYWCGRTLHALGRYEEAIPNLKKAFDRSYYVQAFDLAREAEADVWFLDCLQHLQLCIDKLAIVTDEKEHKQPTLTSKVQAWLRWLIVGDYENRHWQEALQSNTIEGYVQFLVKHPKSTYILDAQGKINTLKTETQNLRTAIRETMVSGEQMSVQFKPTNATSGGYEINISVHLSADYSVYDKSPQVRGFYASHEAHYSLVKRRIAEVYRQVYCLVSNCSGTKLSAVVVSCYHGVRYHFTNYGVEIPDQDKPVPIYTVYIGAEKATMFDWTKITIEQIQETWVVISDEIPCILFE